jgi:FMN reductase
MPSILLLSGSPSSYSRSGALIEHATRHFAAAGISARAFGLRDFPAGDLLLGRYDSPAFDELKRLLADASGVIVATPIYKAAYTAGLKAILDILPQSALRGKRVLPLATGGSPAHLLAIDYALKPVLSALGATDLLQGVYVVDQQLAVGAGGRLEFADEGLRERFEESLAQLAANLLAAAPVA